LADNRRRQGLMAAGGLLGALAASSCLHPAPALLASASAERGSVILTRLAAYQPYSLAANARVPRVAIAGLRSSKPICADGEACARPLPNRIVKTSLILATLLVVAALGLDVIAPLFLDS